MTHEIDLLTIKTKFDSSGFTEMEKAASDSVASVKKEVEGLGRQKVSLDTTALDDIGKRTAGAVSDAKKSIDAFNKSAQLKIESKAFTEDVKRINASLDDLKKQREIVVKVKGNMAIEDIKKIDERIAELTKEKEIRIQVQKGAVAGVRQLKDDLEGLQKIHPKIDASGVIDDLVKIEFQLSKLTEQREIAVKAPDPAKARAEVQKIDKEIDELLAEKEYVIEVAFNASKKSFFDIKNDIKALDKEIADLTKERELHIRMAKSGDAVSEAKIKALDERIDKATRLRELKINLQKGATKEIEEALNGLERKLKTAAIATTALAAAFGGAAYLVSSHLDRIDKESQKLNLTAKTFQELDHVARQSGASVEGLAMSMRTLTLKAVEGDSAFKSIGVNIKNANGKLKDQETLFNEVIAKLQGMEAGTNRSALAFALLGRSAAELEPLINAGAGAMEDLRQEANEFGLVLDARTIKAGDGLSSALGLMTSASKNLFVAGLSPLLPALTDAAANMARFAAEMQPVAKEYIRDLIDGFTLVEAPMTKTGYALIAVAGGLTAYAVASVAAAAQTGIFTVAIKGLTAAMMANPFTAIAVVISAVLIPALVAAWKNIDELKAHWNYIIAVIVERTAAFGRAIRDSFADDFDKVRIIFYALLNAIMEGIATTLEWMDKLTLGANETVSSLAKGARQTVKDLDKTVAGLWEGIKLRHEEAKAANEAGEKIIAEEKAKLEAIIETNKALKEQNALFVGPPAPPKAAAPNAPTSGTGKTDKLKNLEAEYKAQKKIAEALIKDEQRLADALLSIDARYYAEKEKLLRENYADQVARGKAITAEQMRQLEDVAAKARETARDSGLREAEASYQARAEVARRAAGAESAIEAASFEEKKKYLEDKLALLTKNAEESIRLTGMVEEAEIEAIRRTKDEIMRVQVDGAKQNYENRIALAKATFTNEYDLEKELLAAKKEMLQQQLDAMLKAAAEQMALGGQVSAQLIADIRKVRAALDEAANQKPMLDQMKDMAQAFGQYLGGMVDQLGSYFSQQFDNAIQAAERQYKQMSKALDLHLKQQLKEIDDNLKAQRELYEQQLKDLAEIEKEKTKLTEKYTDRRADLLEKMQETMTEEEYDALQAQLEEERLKYEESMAAFDEDNLTREEIEAAKEQAELEAQARKEQAEAEHLAAMEKLQTEYAKKMAKLENEKAKYEKLAGIVKAIISTAVGVANALTLPYPVNIAAAAVVAAMGAVQIATIASQSPPAPPSFYQGGVVGADNAHLYTMVPPPPDPRDKTLIWASQGERVLNPAESEIYHALQAAGFSLSDALYAAHDAAVGAAGAVIDNSRRVVQHNTFEVKESMSWCETRRYARKMQRLGWVLT